MAYPTVSSAYGLQPINRIDGMPYAGAYRQIPVASGNALICDGDMVTLSLGVVDKMTDGTAGVSVGVCVGGSYTNTMGQTMYSQSIPANATNGIAYVVDDPMALFKVAVINGSDVVTPVSREVVGSNMELAVNTGNATTGDSTSGVLAGSETDANTIPIRVIDVVPATATGADAYVELLVKINTHQYNNTTGVV